ncbi:UvrD-helicase domain-containing protein [Myxococcota bacterium]|nr:UvrD-helicase domain-containing protein [Myxococcota bacterium]
MSQPIDFEARRRAVEAIDASMTLSAGAGSGKTSVLTQRILTCLAAGTPPHQIAAITFTEKAAGELQARVRDALEARLTSAPSPALEAALAELSAMTLSTIHSFCKLLLDAEALEAGWAPDSEVDQDISASPALQAAWQGWRVGLDLRLGPLEALLVRLLISDHQLQKTTLAALLFRDLQPVMSDTPFEPQSALEALKPLLQAAKGALAQCKRPEACKLALAYAGLTFNPADDLITLLKAPLPIYTTRGRAADWPAGAREALADALTAINDWRDRQLEGLHARLAADVQAHLLPAVAQAKAEAGLVAFDDLLFRAADLLEDHEVRARLAARFEALLVDEVQDTDPIQARVAALLTRPAVVRDPSWLAAPPMPGRLFAVGDPNQSIYRFRRADVDTWRALSALVGRGGEGLRLDQNFRSAPGIVAWVNHTFADLPDYAPQVPWRAAARLDPVVLLPVEGEGPAQSKAREREALIGHLWSLMRDAAEVIDRASDEPRPMRWGDVMILLPSWSQAEALQAELTRAGIPALVEGGNSFYQRDEIRLCRAALRALIEPDDAQQLLFTLRGLFGLDYNQLAGHKARGGAWREVEGAVEGPVSEALAILGRLRREQAQRSLSWVESLDALLTETGAWGVWSLLADGPARMANLDKLFTHIRRLEAEHLSPQGLLDGLEQLSARGEEDLSRVDVGLDTVRITSYFKSKGLEAPIVALIHADRKASGIEAVVDRVAEEVALRFGPLIPPGWARREAEEKAAQHQERRRWMYVACTRARDQLIIVHPTKKPGNLLALIPEGLIELGGPGVARLSPEAQIRVPDPRTWPEIPWREETFPGLDERLEALLAAEVTSAWVEHGHDLGREAVAEAKGACVAWRTVQDVAHQADAEGGGLGVEAGSLLHEVMERLDFSQAQATLEATARALLYARASLWGVDLEILSHLERILQQILRHEVIDRARRAPERWQEVQFVYPRRGQMIKGAIDLCFPVDEARQRWVIVDWKSALPAEGSAGWGNYQRQLKHYTQALKACLGVEITVEAILVGPSPPAQATLF